MAFQSTRNSNQQKNSSTQSNVGSKKESDSITISGMYDGKEGSKLVAKGMKLKEAVTIPAGYTVKLFQRGGLSKNGKALPTYELVAQPARDAQ